MSLSDHLAADRTVLANERTLLAHIRTALTIGIGGITLYKLFDNELIQMAGIIALALATGVLLYGFVHYRNYRKRLGPMVFWPNDKQ